MRGQGREEKGLFPKGMILSCDPFSVGDRMRRYESCCGTFGRKKSDGADCGL